jgi:hypothetical protein
VVANLSSLVDTRDTLLERASLEAARAWTTEFRAELARDGRPLEGGWPGTMPEARMRASAHASRALVERSMSALTYDELGRIARITYDEARRSWRAVAGDGSRRAR